ncbi:MAG: TIM barrel protein [Candidatus Anstonellaceae archaeon]
MKIRFGPAGVPISSPSHSTKEGIITCASLSLKSMEVEFVHGVKMQQEAAKLCGQTSKEVGVSLSVHAPYYINLCSFKQQVVKNSLKHIFDSITISHYLNAKPIVIHTGFYQNNPKEICKKLVQQAYEELISKAQERKFNFLLGPELTGKKSAYGDLEEIISLAEYFGLDHLIPVIDFAHYHARIQLIKNEDDYRKILDFGEKRLGEKFSKNLHIHFSGIEFNEKGEKKHLPISSNSPPFKPLLKVLKNGGYEGTIICESPLLEKDAILLQKEFEKI